MNGSYRDSSTMHSSSYGYNYNGMDLSINRSASSSHFGAVGESSRGFPSPAQESRFRQTSSCSLSSPDSLPCSNSESHGGKPTPSPSEQATSASITTTTTTTNTNFTELDETSASSGADEGTPLSSSSSSSIPRAQAEPIATSTAATEGQAPQIFPWMRKLHISH
ncbi:homeobox protein Hox-B5-like, partial [Antrostomus carolinensis]|uniref:homeobox protein Hox-B5-like n=1 Tax=Antrostomus carolinensis TaxID=279965 RepID=UPI000528F6B5